MGLMPMSGGIRRFFVAMGAAVVFAAAPGVAGAEVLHDQLSGASESAAVNSQNFETSLDAYDDLGADDFVVPNGAVWRIDRVEVAANRSGTSEAQTANLFLFADAGSLPGGQIFAHPNLARGTGQTYPDLALPISDMPALPPGHYWIGVQANRDFNPGSNNWFWADRAPQVGLPAVWRQPGDGFGDGCTTFSIRSSCAYTESEGTPDQAFRLSGTESRLDLLNAKVKSPKKVRLTVDVPIAGTLQLSSGKLKAQQIQVSGPGQITIAMKTKRSARAKLANEKRVKAQIDLSLSAPLGQPVTASEKVKLKPKRNR
jgi:hypothetical protein